MTSQERVGGVRKRARDLMRSEVAVVVQDLVLQQGYEQTTVDDICRRAQISRSTFFRYFPSKEDAFFGDTLDSAEMLVDALRARPADEAAWTAMRRALDPLIDRYDARDERMRSLTRLLITNPSLAARRREKDARWHELLRPDIAERLDADPDDRSDPRTHAVIAAALGCVEAALFAWVASDPAEPLSSLLDRAMAAPAPSEPSRAPAAAGD